jgi:hypothetical protein
VNNVFNWNNGDNARYSMAFTTGGVFLSVSVKLAELYLCLRDWNSVRNKAIADNLTQSRTQNTLKKVCAESLSRLKTLSQDELELFVNGTHQEQAYLFWLALCRRYRFIADFAVETLRERFLERKADLTYVDYVAFVNRKSEWHPELDKISPSTKAKIRQVVFKALREADLITTGNLINAALLSPRLLKLISKSDILYFPIH